MIPGEVVLERLNHSFSHRYFRGQGKTADGRDAIRVLLSQHGYSNAHVTIDTSDWYVDNGLKARLEAEPRSSLEPYRRFYLDHIWDRATFYDGLAQALFGHAVDHDPAPPSADDRIVPGRHAVDVRERGWRLIDGEAAFASPPFAMEPNTRPAGQSLIRAAAKADGRFEKLLRYPGEDGGYEAPKMDGLGLQACPCERSYPPGPVPERHMDRRPVSGRARAARMADHGSSLTSGINIYLASDCGPR